MKVDVFIRGRHVDLIALSEGLAVNSNWYSWFNDESTTSNMQKHYFPNSREKQLEFFRSNVEGRSDILQLGIVVHGCDELIGIVSLSSIDHINRKAEIAMVMGNEQERRLDVTLEAMSLVISHGFKTLNLRRIYGGTIAEEWAQLLCRSLGFREEGVFREDVFKNGIYRDVYFVAVLRADYSPFTNE